MADIRDIAARWVVRLHDGVLSDEDLLSFDRWLDASLEHRRAYDQALDAWLDLDRLATSANSATPRRGPSRQMRGGARRHQARTWAVEIAAAIAATLALTIWLVGLGMGHAVPYATGKGERRSVTLSDGTHLDLNATTRVLVQLRRDSRRVTLEEGEAAFTIAHDQNRPFVVATRGGLVRDIGTEFNVRQRGGDFAVTVRHGVVQVELGGGLAGTPVRLTPGQRLEHGAGDTKATIRTVTPEDDFSWRRGQLVLRNQSLGAVVAELNFYFARPIRIENSTLASRAVSGVLLVDDEDATLRRLALFTPLRVAPHDGEVLLEPASAEHPGN